MEKQDSEEVEGGIEGLPLWKHDVIVITAGKNSEKKQQKNRIRFENTPRRIYTVI